MNLDRYHAARSIGHQPFRSACYAPFVGLSFDMHGTVSVCAFTRANPLGRVGERPLAEMWNGAVIEELRDAVRADDLALACTRCAEEIAGGNLHGLLASGFDPFVADERAPWPARMEFALTNACNLQCVMCSGEFSSSIRSQREGLPPLPSLYGAAFLEELGPFIDHLRQARFLGGEPFLAEINFRIWELMIERGSSAECNVTTNGTQWNRRIASVLDRLPFSVGISIDGTSRATVESIRAGSSYERIMANLDRFLAYRERTGASVSLTFCLMVDNWHEFADYLLFGEERGCQVFVNTVRQPPRHSLYRLPTDELRAIVDRLEADRDRVAHRLELNRNVWNEQLDRLRAELEERTASGEPTWRPVVQRRFGELLGRLADPAADDEDVVGLLRSAACDGLVWIVRCDAEDRIVQGDRYLGVDLGPAGVERSAELFVAAADQFGHRIDIVDERIVKGAPSRLVSYQGPGRTPTIVATVTRRGPSPYAVTKMAAILVSGERFPDRPVSVTLGPRGTAPT